MGLADAVREAVGAEENLGLWRRAMARALERPRLRGLAAALAPDRERRAPRNGAAVSASPGARPRTRWLAGIPDRTSGRGY